jgi:hypothetical protein
MYLQQGRPRFTYNYFGSKYTTLEGKQALPPGKSVLRYDFAYDGGGLGTGGTAKLYANNVLVAEARIDATVPLGFTADETLDDFTSIRDPSVQSDLGSPTRSNSFRKIIGRNIASVCKVGWQFSAVFGDFRHHLLVQPDIH